MLNKGELKYSFHILNTLKILQSKFGEQEIQSKYIVHKLKPLISTQTIYKTLQILVRDDYITRYEQGKFVFYNMTNKGMELLDELVESYNKVVAKPIVEYMIDIIRKNYPKEFRDVSDNDLDIYLYELIKEFKKSIINNAIKNFA